MTPKPGTFSDDPKLEEIRQALDRADDQHLALFIAERDGMPPRELAGEIIRDFFGQIDFAWMFETLYELRRTA